MSQYNHLKKYPYLLRFCKENQIPILPYSHGYDQLLLSDIVASSIPNQLIDVYESRKEVLNKCLRFGYEHGTLDNDIKARLKGEAKDFWQAVSEMKVGVWLEEQGIKIICFKPPSKNGGIGDYLIRGSGQDVFIEVKTLFGERYFLEQRRLAEDIAQYCQTQKLPVERVNPVQYPEDYGYANNKCRLLKEVGESISKYLPLKERRTISYSERNGIKIEIDLNPKASRVSIQYGGVSGLRDVLKIRLGMCVGGIQGKLQTSAQNIPSVCIIDDFSDSKIDRFVIEDVLYGSGVEDSTQSHTVVSYRKSDGKWSGLSPSELSSVFILEFEPNTTKVKTLSVYLCPNPKYELSKLTFPEAKNTWWKLDKEGYSLKPLNY